MFHGRKWCKKHHTLVVTRLASLASHLESSFFTIDTSLCNTWCKFFSALVLFSWSFVCGLPPAAPLPKLLLLSLPPPNPSLLLFMAKLSLCKLAASHRNAPVSSCCWGLITLVSSREFSLRSEFSSSTLFTYDPFGDNPPSSAPAPSPFCSINPFRPLASAVPLAPLVTSYLLFSALTFIVLSFPGMNVWPAVSALFSLWL